MRKQCAQVLPRLQKDKRSVWFNAPVEVEELGLHDYHAVIRRPMDLGTVKAGLAKGRAIMDTAVTPSFSPCHSRCFLKDSHCDPVVMATRSDLAVLSALAHAAAPFSYSALPSFMQPLSFNVALNLPLFQFLTARM